MLQKVPTFFKRSFTIIFLLVFMCGGAVAALSFGILTRYAESQIGAQCLNNVRGNAKTLAVFEDSLARDALQMTMLLSQAAEGRYQVETFLEPITDSILFRRDLRKYLNRLVQVNPIFHSIYLYIENSDYVISSASEYALSGQFTDNDWLERYRESGMGGDLWLGTRNATILGGGSARVMTYICPISVYLSGSVHGLMVFNLSESGMLSMINSNNPRQTALITRQGEVICSGMDERSLGILARMQDDPAFGSNASEGTIAVRGDGNSTLIGYTSVRMGDGWLLAQLYDSRSLYAMRNRSTTAQLIVLGVVLTFSLLFVYFGARRLSEPIARLKEQVETDERFRNADPDEIRNIEKALTWLQREDQRLSGEIEKRNFRRRLRYTQALFLNDALPDAIDTDPQAKRLCDERDNLTLYLSDDWRVSRLREKGEAERRQYQTLLAQMCQQALDWGDQPVTTFPVDDDTVLVLHRELAWQDDDLDRLLDTLKRFTEEAYRSLGLSVTIGVSTPWQTAGNARNSYLEARESARMKLIRGYRSVMYYEDVPRQNRRPYYPAQLERQVLDATTAGDRGRTIEMIHRFVENLRQARHLTVDDVMLVLHVFTGALVRQLSDSSQGMLGPEALEILDEVYYGSIVTLDEMEALLTQQVSRAIDSRVDRDKEESAGLASRVVAYVDANYTRDISIEEISSHLGLSYSYVRKLFKDSTGKSIMDCINEKRLQKAKELLENSTMSVREIGTAVGFNSEQSFYRSFRKYEAILPGQYRSQHRQT